MTFTECDLAQLGKVGKQVDIRDCLAYLGLLGGLLFLELICLNSSSLGGIYVWNWFSTGIH